jgi:hypothetical protein
MTSPRQCCSVTAALVVLCGLSGPSVATEAPAKQACRISATVGENITIVQPAKEVGSNVTRFIREPVAVPGALLERSVLGGVQQGLAAVCSTFGANGADAAVYNIESSAGRYIKHSPGIPLTGIGLLALAPRPETRTVGPLASSTEKIRTGCYMQLKISRSGAALAMTQTIDAVDFECAGNAAQTDPVTRLLLFTQARLAEELAPFWSSSGGK